MSGFITYVLTCADCSSPVGVFTDGNQEHIRVIKSYTLMSDTAVIIEKDHNARIDIDPRNPKQWWKKASQNKS